MSDRYRGEPGMAEGLTLRSRSPEPSEEDEIGRALSETSIPWHFTSNKVRTDLALKLDHVDPHQCDWRGLANALGYDNDFLKAVPNRVGMAVDIGRSSTIYLFEEYQKDSDSSVREIRNALLEIGNIPCVKILDAAIPGMIDSFRQPQLRRRPSDKANPNARRRVQEPHVDSTGGERSAVGNHNYTPSPAHVHRGPTNNMATVSSLAPKAHHKKKLIQRAVNDTISLSSTAVDYDGHSVRRMPLAAASAAAYDTTTTATTTGFAHMEETPADVPNTIMLNERERYNYYHLASDDSHSSLMMATRGGEAEVHPASRYSPSHAHALPPSPSPQRHRPRTSDSPKRKYHVDTARAPSKVPRDASPASAASPFQPPMAVAMDLSTNRRPEPNEKVTQWLDSIPDAGPKVLAEKMPSPLPGGLTGMVSSPYSPMQVGSPHCSQSSSPTVKLENERVTYNAMTMSPSPVSSPRNPRMTSQDAADPNSFNSYVPSESLGSFSNAVTEKAPERCSIDDLAEKLDGSQFFNTVPRASTVTYKSASAEGTFDRFDNRNRTMPSNAKPGPFHTATRKITAFITYSFDSKDHMKNVINLAKNLQRNGFGVAIDEKDKAIYERDKDLVPDSEKKEVNKLRYQKADFVVVCISPRYRADLDEALATDRETPFTTRKGTYKLHTKFIYKMMYQDLAQHVRSNRQFVVCLMSGGGPKDVPHWLRNSQIYHWPQQYLDFNYYLSDPERILNQSIHKHQKQKPHNSI